MPVPVILLLDNGSLEPSATLSLREIAGRLGTRIGCRVTPVSALHSNSIPADELGGQPAEILEEALEGQVAAGNREFAILPLFFGPSGLLTDHLPRVLRRISQNRQDIFVRVAPPLLDACDGSDGRIASILASRIRPLIPHGGRKPAVILVDHGSPSRAVSAVRDFVAGQLRQQLGDTVRAVQPASMERRPGAEFSFNDPLLAAALDLPEFSSGTVIVTPLFLAPGRHAGPGGDIDRICADAEKRHPDLRILRTAPIGSDPAVIEILADRAKALLG